MAKSYQACELTAELLEKNAWKKAAYISKDGIYVNRSKNKT